VVRVKDVPLEKGQRRLTPKQRVLKKCPEAYAKATTPTYWVVYGLSKPNRYEVEYGTGTTAAEAWADAARKL
jgi:hypothetical protein